MRVTRHLNNTVESYYVWQQENKYFVLRVNSPIRKENIELCHSEAVPIPAIDSPVIDGKYVELSPQTSDITVIIVSIAAMSAVGWNYAIKKRK